MKFLPGDFFKDPLPASNVLIMGHILHDWGRDDKLMLPAAKWLGVAADSAGRIKVQADLSVGGWPNVYVIGDTALSTAWKGQAVPGLAPAAKQAGAFVARAIGARLQGQSFAETFVYHHRGSLATIGRKAAVADFGRIRLWGAPAWWLWGLVHLGFLVGLRNRVATMINWFWAYLTFGGGIRLITGGDSMSTVGEGRPIDGGVTG